MTDISDSCPHENIIDESGFCICTDCGEQIIDGLDNREWKNRDTRKYNPDINRIQIRKLNDNGIYHDVENMNFPDEIVAKANEIYEQSTKKEIYRGNKRRARIYACIYYAYMMKNIPISPDSLMKEFKINEKSASEGFKQLKLNSNNDFSLSSPCISPSTIINETMDRLSATNKQKDEVQELYKQIQNKSSELNRARPQSVACGLVFYWIIHIRKNNNITLEDFAKSVALSKLTISRVTNEIEIIFDRQKIMSLLENFELTQDQKRNLFNLFVTIKKSTLFKNKGNVENEDMIKYIVYYWLLKNEFRDITLNENIYNNIEKFINRKKITL